MCPVARAPSSVVGGGGVGLQTSIAAVAARLDRVAVMRGLSLHGLDASSPSPGGGRPRGSLSSPSRAHPPPPHPPPSPAASARDTAGFDARLDLVQAFAQRLEEGPRPGTTPRQGPWAGSGHGMGPPAPPPPPAMPFGTLPSPRGSGWGGEGAVSPVPSQSQDGVGAEPAPRPLSAAARQLALVKRLAVARSKSPPPLSSWPSSPRCMPAKDQGACTLCVVLLCVHACGVRVCAWVWGMGVGMGMGVGRGAWGVGRGRGHVTLHMCLWVCGCGWVYRIVDTWVLYVDGVLLDWMCAYGSRRERELPGCPSNCMVVIPSWHHHHP